MINFKRIAEGKLQREPYTWAEIGGLFGDRDARSLAKTFPRDNFKRLWEYGGAKDYEFHSRELVGMGATTVSRAELLSDAWKTLGNDLLSPAYRAAMSALTGIDLSDSPLEVNVFHYPPGSSHGAHPDLRDKIVTQVIYFNEGWDDADGGGLLILRSSDGNDVHHTISPQMGNSAVLVRSANSWHAVRALSKGIRGTRRSLTAVFYHPGSVSTMWPPGDETPLHDYVADSRWLRLVASVKARFARARH